jgi:hypothetical protein
MNLFYYLVMDRFDGHTFGAKKICHETIKDLCMCNSDGVYPGGGILCGTSDRRSTGVRREGGGDSKIEPALDPEWRIEKFHIT